MLVDFARLQQIEKRILANESELESRELTPSQVEHLENENIRLWREKEELLYPEESFGKRKYRADEEW